MFWETLTSPGNYRQRNGPLKGWEMGGPKTTKMASEETLVLYPQTYMADSDYHKLQWLNLEPYPRSDPQTQESIQIFLMPDSRAEHSVSDITRGCWQWLSSRRLRHTRGRSQHICSEMIHRPRTDTLKISPNNPDLFHAVPKNLTGHSCRMGQRRGWKSLAQHVIVYKAIFT